MLNTETVELEITICCKKVLKCPLNPPGSVDQSKPYKNQTAVPLRALERIYYFTENRDRTLTEEKIIKKYFALYLSEQVLGPLLSIALRFKLALAKQHDADIVNMVFASLE